MKDVTTTTPQTEPAIKPLQEKEVKKKKGQVQKECGRKKNALQQVQNPYSVSERPRRRT